MEDIILAIDLGATNILYGVANVKGDILYKNVLATNSNLGANYVLSKLANIIERLLAEHNKKGQVKAVIVATPGPLSHPDKIVYNSPNLHWNRVAIKKELQARLNHPTLPIMIEKDTNMAVLGEYYFGQDRQYSNLIYITVSTGIGGGIIINDRLYRGANGGAGEIGHLVVKPNGERCGCGQYGCLEALASGRAIAKQAQERIIQVGFPHIGSKEVGELARQGNSLAIAILDEALDNLARGLANVVNLFNPNIMVLGGGVIEGLQDLWLDRLVEKVLGSVFKLNAQNLKIEMTKLGGDIGLYGCVAAYVFFKEGQRV